jgi:acetolactate synthase-1/2/3 large subunit
MSETSGGEVLARMLQAEGVEKVFGIIDGTYFGFYSSLHRLGIEIVTPRHETCAAHMAGAYARLTGRLGVCMASNGPGVANLLPGLAVENAEGNRVLAITSCRRPQIVYPDRGGTYQSFDQVGAISHLAKWSHAVVSFDRVAELGRTALRYCWDGRPGVVHLDVPETIMNGKVKADVPIWQPHQYRRVDRIVPDPEQVERAAGMLAAAELPMIHAGSGIIHADAFDELRRVAELLHNLAVLRPTVLAITASLPHRTSRRRAEWLPFASWRSARRNSARLRASRTTSDSDAISASAYREKRRSCAAAITPSRSPKWW